MKVIVIIRYLLPLALLPFLSLAQNSDPEEDESDIDGPEGSFQALGKRCGRRHPCMEGLDCYPAPVLKRCFPITCAFESMMTAMETTGFDVNTYGTDMMTLAGISVEDPKSSNMFRRFPDNQLNAVNTSSSDLESLLQIIRSNPPPLEVITESFRSCTRATVEGVTPYFGASWGLGLLGTYNGDVFWVRTFFVILYGSLDYIANCEFHISDSTVSLALLCFCFSFILSIFITQGQGSGDPAQLATLNNCFGAVLGYDLGISGLVGIAMTGTIADLQDGCKQMFPIASFPPVSIELGVIDCDDPVFLIEMTAGIDASAGLPGYTTCTTTAL